MFVSSTPPSPSSPLYAVATLQGNAAPQAHQRRQEITPASDVDGIWGPDKPHSAGVVAKWERGGGDVLPRQGTTHPASSIWCSVAVVSFRTRSTSICIWPWCSMA